MLSDVGDLDSIPKLGRSPGGGTGNPLQHSCLEIPGTEKPGGLGSIGSQRVRLNLAHMHMADRPFCTVEISTTL